jgi:hypothetical protein
MEKKFRFYVICGKKDGEVYVYFSKSNFLGKDDVV